MFHHFPSPHSLLFIIHSSQVLRRWTSGETRGVDTLAVVATTPDVGGLGLSDHFPVYEAVLEFSSPLDDEAALFRTALLSPVTWGSV